MTNLREAIIIVTEAKKRTEVNEMANLAKAKECALKQVELIQSAVEDLQARLAEFTAEGKHPYQLDESLTLQNYCECLKILKDAGLLDD